MPGLDVVLDEDGGVTEGRGRLSAGGIEAKVMNTRLAALSMSSTPMNTMIALRRRSTVADPMANSSTER